MKLESYLGPAGIWSLNSILYAVEPVIFLINHLWTIHGIKPRFLNAAHGPFHHLATALSFSKPYSHQSLGNLTLQSPTFTGLCTHLTFSFHHSPFTPCELLHILHIKFMCHDFCEIFPSPQSVQGQGFCGDTVQSNAFHIWGGWKPLSQPGLDLALIVLTSAFLLLKCKFDQSGSHETQPPYPSPHEAPRSDSLPIASCIPSL